VDRETRRQGRPPGRGPALLAGLGDVADDDVVDCAGIDAIALDHTDQELREQIHGVDVSERARRLAVAHRTADGIDDYCTAHELPPVLVEVGFAEEGAPAAAR
jgi:hypothetical protein